MSEPYKPQDRAPNRNSHTAPDLKDQAKSVGRQVKNKAESMTDTVVQAAQQQATKLGESAKEMVGDAADKVQSALSEQKTAGADYLGNIAQVVHRAAGAFEDEVPQAARYIHQAAGQLDTVANAVRERDMRELVGEVQQFARRQPALFFGGAMILGFAAIRFFKSSANGSGASGSSGWTEADNSFSRSGNSDFPQDARSRNS